MKQTRQQMKNNLTRPDDNHSFNPNVAAVIKVPKAIILKEINGWCDDNQRNGRNIHFGLPWTFNTAKGYSNKFFYLPAGSIARWLKELESAGWIFSGNFNKRKGDQTKWYTPNRQRYIDAINGKQWSRAEVDLWIKTVKDLTISQNENCSDTNSQNERTISHFERTISHFERTLPSLTTISITTISEHIRAREGEILIETLLDLELGKCEDWEIPVDDQEEKEVPDLAEIIEDVDMQTAAERMNRWYLGEGAETWKWFCVGSGARIDQFINPMPVCMAWASKNADNPHVLREWKKYAPKLFNWVQRHVKTLNLDKAKIKKLNHDSNTEVGNIEQRLRVVDQLRKENYF